MAYSPRLRKAVGAVREALAQAGLERQSPEFSKHGSHAPLPQAPLVLVACSGGRDSIALAQVSHIVCGMLGLRCGAVIINHQLQPDSRQVAQQAADVCAAIGLDPVLIRDVQVCANGEGTEAAARAVRYRELCATAQQFGAACVLLAHTMDDQAETVLLGLLRGRGLDMVCGMPASTIRDGVRFVRPLLSLTREDTTGICADLGLRYWDDPTNGDAVEGALPRTYPLRSRIRHDLLPAIAQFAGGDVVRHFADNARLMRMDKAYLDAQADAVSHTAVRFSADPSDSDTSDTADTRAMMVSFDVRALADQVPSIRLRVLAHALSQAAITASAAQIEAIDRLITDWHGQSAVNLPRGYSANRKKHVIRVCQDRAHANR
ncbi:tRNA lysidine(34) synthetase TilS [Bifidobacterium sp. LC6]|uniref:tRNA(Ile)-lysidine synthase n=1 Tax=Bifidobacterium colobi TaxID=2809026 RepID=A0ABS5UVK4_9BIFI|nr:tRNA lysidine(34) synthetase TilS [Bifidobacterium colobi]MBT1175107.1 tRNA lysidine(34) synthetase TilS [Bifidobacterium colobi]